MRVWRDQPEEALRGRVTACIDIDLPRDEVTVAGSRAELVEIVRNWLERFASS
jgi:hypothetical protein